MVSSFTPTYKPSWIDRLIDWIEGLPIPIWSFYSLLYLVAATSLNLASWFNRVSPWGTLSIVQLYNAIWLPLALMVIHNTDRLTDQALTRFAPLVRSKATELEGIRYRMTAMPARTVLSISIIAVTVLLAGAIQEPELIINEMAAGPIHPLAWVLSALFGITSYSLAPVMIYHAIRQLILVTKAYELIDDVNVFHQQPLYAFSGLTMRTALFLVGAVYITYLGESLYASSSTEEMINFALSAVIIPLSIAIVLLPLLGIHQRLVNAKAGVLEENSTQIAGTRGMLYAAIDKQAYADINGLDNAMGSLYKERDQLKSIPTWPWAAGAFRNFLSAVLLPMALWVLQTLAARYF